MLIAPATSLTRPIDAPMLPVQMPPTASSMPACGDRGARAEQAARAASRERVLWSHGERGADAVAEVLAGERWSAGKSRQVRSPPVLAAVGVDVAAATLERW